MSNTPLGPVRVRPRWQDYRLILGCLVVAALVCALSSAIGDQRFHNRLQRARREVAEGRFGAARDTLASLAAWRPGHAEIQYQLGLCEVALKQPDRAIQAWAAVPSGAPEAPQAALGRAMVLIESYGRLAEAEPLLQIALRGPVKIADSALWELNMLLLREGRIDESRRLLERGWARAPAPKRVEYLREHWRLDHAITSDESVRTLLDAAARHSPDDDRYQLALAAQAIQYGRWDDAERHLDACLVARPEDPAVWRVRLAWAVAAERPEQAARALTHLPKGRLEPCEVIRLRAWFAARQGDCDGERRALEALAHFDPGDTSALERLTALAQQAGAAARAASLRALMARTNRDHERYRWGVLDLPANPERERLEALSRLAEALGRDFESKGWLALAAMRGMDSPPPSASTSRAVPAEASFTALLAIAAQAREVRRAPGTASLTVPTFRSDDFGVFRYQWTAGPVPQTPQVMGGGCAVIDYDGDGWLDVFLVQGGEFPGPGRAGPSADRLYRNRGDGTFEDVSERSGIASLPGGFGIGVTAGDYDNDGHPDLFLTRWRSYALFRNKGDGTFEDVTDRAGLSGNYGLPMSAALADLDNDGDLDLYVCQYVEWDPTNPPVCRSHIVPGRAVLCGPHQFRAEPDRLFRNDGGRFVDVTHAAGIHDSDGRGLGVVAADLDGDGRIDLYVANDQSPNYLFRNLGGLRFEEVGFAAGAACSADGVARAGMGIACGDLDGDGRPDLAVTNFFTESMTFYHNLGGGSFRDDTDTVGLMHATRFVLGFGDAFLDADNDGALDLAVANGHVSDERPTAPFAMSAQLFQGNRRRLTDVSARAGPPWAEPVVGRGLAVGDLDNDGRPDVLIVAQNHPIIYARNTTAGAGHFVTFRLDGTTSNRDAVGARVTVVTAGRRAVAWRLGGGSYLSSSDPRLHFGLGAARTIDEVEVAWPSGRVDRFRNLPADTGYLLREAAPAPAPLPGFAR